MTTGFGRTGKRPTVGCDNVIFKLEKSKLFVLLIKRGHAPYKGKWALPGGFMEWNESCEGAAARELAEETGLRGIRLKPVGVFSEPGRDPRGTIISVSYWAEFRGNKLNVRGGDDATEAVWFNINDCPALAFDHDMILQKALKLRERELTEKKG